VLVVRFTSLWFGVFWGRHGIQFEFVGHCFSASYYFFFFLFSVPRRSVRIMHCAYRNTHKCVCGWFSMSSVTNFDALISIMLFIRSSKDI